MNFGGCSPPPLTWEARHRAAGPLVPGHEVLSISGAQHSAIGFSLFVFPFVQCAIGSGIQTGSQGRTGSAVGGGEGGFGGTEGWGGSSSGAVNAHISRRLWQPRASKIPSARPVTKHRCTQHAQALWTRHSSRIATLECLSPVPLARRATPPHPPGQQCVSSSYHPYYEAPDGHSEFRQIVRLRKNLPPVAPRTR